MFLILKGASMILPLLFTLLINAAATEIFFDEHSAAYPQLVEDIAYHGPDWIERKKAYFTPERTAVLDIACADGYMGRKILSFNPDAHITGLDVSKKMLETCLDKGGYRELIQADVNKGLPESIMHNRYDIALATGFLEYVQDLKQLFTHVSQLLHKNGLFFLTIEVFEPTESANCFSIARYTQEETQQLLMESGFTIIDWEFHKAGYIDISTKKNVPYFFIIAQVKN